MVTINYKDGRPFYEQVKEDLRRLVVSGVLRPGDKLPSVRELAGQLAINPNTIQRAYRELEAGGLIYTVAGRGAFAAPGTAAADRRREELLVQWRQTTRELMGLDTDLSRLRAELEQVYREEDEA